VLKTELLVHKGHKREKWTVNSTQCQWRLNLCLYSTAYNSEKMEVLRANSNHLFFCILTQTRAELCCTRVRHFPGPAFSSLCSFLIRHFQVLQIQRPRRSNENLHNMRTPSNIRINLISPETRVHAEHFCCWHCGSTFIVCPMQCTALDRIKSL